MKFILENFGPIRHYELDIDKDLICVFGTNSIGKSYARSLL